MGNGDNTFNTVGITLKTPATGSLPTIPITVYRIDEKPYPASDSLYSKYWIWRNWAINKTFASIDSVGFSDLMLKNSDLANPANFKLHYRPVVSYGDDWIFSNKTADDATGTNLSIKNLTLGSYGQFILSRKPNPCLSNTILTDYSGLSKQKVQSLNTFGIEWKFCYR
ncbi:MAG: hypothetical protein U5M51_07705 [Emticicia sp.]|nr:hypothetical protein [Emticicia sp.]